MALWEVVGGADKGRGGIIVRSGAGFDTSALSERLANGALVQEIELRGERLHYRLLEGDGPSEGWVSVSIKGKVLLNKRPSLGASAVSKSTLPADLHELSSDQQDSAEEEDVAEGDLGPCDDGNVVVDEVLKGQFMERVHDSQQFDQRVMACRASDIIEGLPLPPKLRLICLHPEACSSTAFLGPNSPLASWAERTVSEVLALILPGRARLLTASLVSDGAPYVVWGHGLGAWVGFEMLALARKVGLPAPRAAVFASFPAPHLPRRERPWPKTKRMNDDLFRKEIEKWDEEHFKEAARGALYGQMWKDGLSKIFRDDFHLLEEYRFSHAGEKRFDFPIHGCHMEKGGRIKEEHVAAWSCWTSPGNFHLHSLDGMGHMTSLFKPDLRELYFERVIAALEQN
eukprot:CAMPEP_0178392480 /NCGR_PEP_ID=MMETSP0689_2-20121128/11700_1 /TAXON_ID=160604 /ORGANISM="Amphidinium massartii, Strain CS-259" /LENGTH=399 /DNA_ID=CAMNT_0020013055 /DNA_START=39 /DNA_END=1238 /DNA_ORIENTATION=-